MTRNVLAGLKVLSLILLVGCGTQGSPIGGAKDLKGPVLLRASPRPESRGIRPSEVVFTFDEYLKAAQVEKGVFVAPPPPGRAPQVYAQGKTLRVRFREPERLEDRTYVITLGPDVRDDHEGNPLRQVLQYAFTPGRVLDTCSVAGRVVHPLTAEPMVGYLVCVFDADSVASRGIHDLRPLMAGQTDSSGYYLISYLRPGRYVVFGFRDKDGTFTWSQQGEGVAQDPDTLMNLAPAEAKLGWDLFAFQPDTTAPRLRRVETLNPRLLSVEVNEPLVAGEMIVGPDTFRIVPGSDALNPTGVSGIYQLALSHSVQDSFSIRLAGLVDTVGNRALHDSVHKVKLKKTGKAKRVLEVAPGPSRPDPYEVALLFSTRLNPDSAAKYIWVVDSSRKRIDGVRHTTEGSRVIVKLPAERDPENTLVLVVDTLLYADDSLRLPRRARYELEYPKSDKFGSFDLKLTSAKPKLLIRLENLDVKDLVWTVPGGAIELPYLVPGKYRVSVIEDDDGNGRWTPGRVWPRRLSETVYHYPGTVLIRGGWSQSLNIQYPDPAAEQAP